LQVFKDDLFSRYKTALRKLRLDGKLRGDVDEDLISFMYATTMFNMILFYREYGIRDEDMQSKLKEYFYSNFFRHGLLKDGAEPEEEG
jgi:hypothetical protein